MQTLGTGAVKLDLQFQIGSARDITFTFTESDGTDTDISLWTFEFFIKRFAGDRLKTFSLTLGSGLSFPVYEDNQLLAEISTSNSSIEEGEYYWELRRTDENRPLINGNAYFSFEAETGDISSVEVTSGSQTIAVTIYGAFASAASQSEVDAGTVTNKYVSPKTLNDWTGASSGDVVGPASATDSNFAAFDTGTGKLLKDSGSSASSFATAAQGALAATALQPDTGVVCYDVNQTPSSVTGTVTQTLLYSVLIPAGTFQANDTIEISGLYTKAGTAAVASHSLAINTSASVSGATTIGVYTTSTNTAWAKVRRSIFFRGATNSQIVVSAGTSTFTDEQAFAVATTILSIDFSVNQYIIFASTLASAADTVTLQSTKITISR